MYAFLWSSGFLSAAAEISAKEGFVSGLRPTISELRSCTASFVMFLLLQPADLIEHKLIQIISNKSRAEKPLERATSEVF